MGNCQAAEAATVTIQHPSGLTQKFYNSLTASGLMASNPGHYIAVIITSRPPISNSSAAAAAAPVKYLKLLRPDDTLHIGHIYRLISFQEVVSVFGSKKKVRLSRLVVGCKEKSKSKSRERRGGGDRAEDSGDSSPAATKCTVHFILQFSNLLRVLWGVVSRAVASRRRTTFGSDFYPHFTLASASPAARKP